MMTVSSICALGVAAARRALDRRVLALWLFALTLPTAIVAIAAAALLARPLLHSIAAQLLASSLVFNSIIDLLLHPGLVRGINAASLAASLVLFMLAPWMQGVIVTAARAREPRPWRGLVTGGLDEYWRMLRIGLLWLVLMAVLMAFAAHLMDVFNAHLAHAILSGPLQIWYCLGWLLLLLLYLLIEFTIEATRASCAAFPRRPSVLRAWLATWLLLRRKGGAVLLTCVPLTVIGFVVAAALTWCRMHVDQGNAIGLLLALALAELFALTMAWVHCARIFVLTSLWRGMD